MTLLQGQGRDIDTGTMIQGQGKGIATGSREGHCYKGKGGPLLQGQGRASYKDKGGTLLQGQGRDNNTGSRKGHCYRVKEMTLLQGQGRDSDTGQGRGIAIGSVKTCCCRGNLEWTLLMLLVSNVTRTRKGHYYRSNMEGKLLQQFGRDIVTRATCKGHIYGQHGTGRDSVK